ncbi:NAD-binding protein, partial [Streptomyces sp. T-3]|nr:NAD-binding protein [Streptomyces sp. T-3]
MVVCGDDALAQGLASELREVYGEPVTLVVPPAGRGAPLPLSGRARATSLLGRVSAAVGRATGNGNTNGNTNSNANDAGNSPGPAPGDSNGSGWTSEDLDAATPTTRLVEAAELTDEILVSAGIQQAAALALVHGDDETNIRAALTARRLNPRLRLVIRLYNRKLGQHLEQLLDQAAVLASPGRDAATALDASTTVLSDADTAAPALAATAVAGTSKVVQADGLLLRAVEQPPPRRGEVPRPGLCTLALLSSTSNDPAGTEGSDISGAEGPQLLPDDRTVGGAPRRGPRGR